MQNNIIAALVLSLLAGMATAVGGLLSFFVKKDNFNILALGLGFSAGVMIFVSFMEILPQAQISFREFYPANTAGWITLVCFFLGIIIAALADMCLKGKQHLENKSLSKENKLKHLSIFTAVALALHNFPEGLATFMSTLQSPALGLSIALAVAVHNIPEGIAVSLPIYHANGSRKKAFLLATLSGLAEPLGAFAGFLFFSTLLHGAAFAVLFAMVAGMMVYISLDELLPTAHEYGEPHKVIWGVICGMLLMAVTLQVF